MSETEKISIENLVEKLKGLDQKDLILVNNSAETLKARKELENQEKAPA